MAQGSSVPDYISFMASKAGDTGFTGILTVQDKEGYTIGPIAGNLTVEVYSDRDYQKKIFERTLEVGLSSGWGTWGLNKVPAWYMPRIAFKDIGNNLPDYIYIRAIFKNAFGEFTDKTLQSTT